MNSCCELIPNSLSWKRKLLLLGMLALCQSPSQTVARCYLMDVVAGVKRLLTPKPKQNSEFLTARKVAYERVNEVLGEVERELRLTTEGTTVWENPITRAYFLNRLISHEPLFPSGGGTSGKYFIDKMDDRKVARNRVMDSTREVIKNFDPSTVGKAYGANKLTQYIGTLEAALRTSESGRAILGNEVVKARFVTELLERGFLDPRRNKLLAEFVTWSGRMDDRAEVRFAVDSALIDWGRQGIIHGINYNRYEKTYDGVRTSTFDFDQFLKVYETYHPAFD